MPCGKRVEATLKNGLEIYKRPDLKAVYRLVCPFCSNHITSDIVGNVYGFIVSAEVRGLRWQVMSRCERIADYFNMSTFSPILNYLSKKLYDGDESFSIGDISTPKGITGVMKLLDQFEIMFENNTRKLE